MQPACSDGTTDRWAQWLGTKSFRVSVPYFTYQLKANKDVVTTGLCAR